MYDDEARKQGHDGEMDDACLIKTAEGIPQERELNRFPDRQPRQHQQAKTRDRRQVGQLLQCVVFGKVVVG